jgi:adenylyl cyclase-associated protein
VTAGLKRVTDDMKTKNRPDRTSVVKMPEAAPPSCGAALAGSVGRGGSGKGVGGVPTGPARLELVDRKWSVEYQVRK